MDLRLGLITAHRADWQARRLSRALGSFGAVETIDPAALRVICGRALDGRDALLLLADGLDARRFDAVVLGRVTGSNVDPDIALDAARAFDLLGVPCLNRAGPMLMAQDKLWTAAMLAHAGIPTPLCSSVPRPVDALISAAELGACVAKPLFGSLGEGQFRCDERQGRMQLARVVRSQQPYLVQRFIPTGGSDYRLFVIGDRVEACIRRESVNGDFRTNAARGGRAMSAVPHRSWRDIALGAARALGLELAGIDLAVHDGQALVLEANGFPNFRSIHEVTGRDMAPAIAAHVAEIAKAGRRHGEARRRGGRVRARAHA